jgi:eukaryotic-like serine/threonine-protein kinase
LIGAVIGNYQIVQKLGEGGMGVVYLGQHTLLGRRAAIKVLLPMLSARPDIVNRFFNEARAVTTISDPGIVQVFDFGYHTDGSAFIVMEFLEGEPLDRRLARLGTLPVVDALRLCRQIASSLAAAHAQHIIHRDLKPENIFLVRDGEVASGERSKILDFGIAKLSDDQPGMVKTSAGALMGTPVYMSPEQCRGLADLDHRSDIYALGCVLFHLITGRPPFEGEGMGDIIAAHIREPAPAPSSRVPGIPPNVDALVLHCLAKAPADRYQSMTELAAAIGQVLPYLTSPETPAQWAPGYQAGGTPPPAPYPSQPGAPGSPPYPSQPGAPGAPYPSQPGGSGSPPYASRPGTPPPPPAGTRPPTPTTLGASTGQVASTVPPAPSRKLGKWLAGVALLGIAATAGAVIATRNAATPVAATAHDAGIGAAPVTPDAVAVPMAIDAGVPVASPPDAAPADAAVDAAVDAPPDAPARRPHRPRGTPRSGSTTVPSGCDRSVDTDCDGIPDVR